MTDPKARTGTSIEVEMFADLESGEPCIDTLEWLQREAPPEVFQATLRLIVNRDGYSCDDETEAWARAHLAPA